MPIFGLGLHILIALFFAAHAVRRGRELYWLIILFSFPLLGSIVYFLAIYLPDSRLEHGIRKATVAAAKTLDPDKELREAQRAFDLTPTAQNQMRLAQALLNAGVADKAAQLFESCLKGPFANDPEIRFGAAKARLQLGEAGKAIEFLQAIQKHSPDFRSEAVAILLAQSFAAAGRLDEARNMFSHAVERFGSIEARVEHAIWSLKMGDVETARNLKHDVDHAAKHWNKYSRSINKHLLSRLDEAFSAARQ